MPTSRASPPSPKGGRPSTHAPSSRKATLAEESIADDDLVDDELHNESCVLPGNHTSVSGNPVFSAEAGVPRPLKRLRRLSEPPRDIPAAVPSRRTIQLPPAPPTSAGRPPPPAQTRLSPGTSRAIVLDHDGDASGLGAETGGRSAAVTGDGQAAVRASGGNPFVSSSRMAHQQVGDGSM